MSRSELSKGHVESGLNFTALRKEPFSVALLALVHREYHKGVATVRYKQL
jgi:hypothetical protein